MKFKKKIIIFPSIFLIILMGYIIWYFCDYYHVTDYDKAISNTENVTVIKTNTGWFYDGPGEENAIIFYPGAKVDELAYSELLKQLANEGVDCFLVKMPFHFAIFGINKADDVISQNSYEKYYMMGHSLGGAMAAVYTKDHLDKLDGLILLASYSTEDLSDSDLKTLCIYGDTDQVLSTEKLEECKSNMPNDYIQYCIEGANHAGFGDYGKQKKDGEATISPTKQKQITEEQIMMLINSGKE